MAAGASAAAAGEVMVTGLVATRLAKYDATMARAKRVEVVTLCEDMVTSFTSRP